MLLYASALVCFSLDACFAPARQNYARVGWRRSARLSQIAGHPCPLLADTPARNQIKPSADNLKMTLLVFAASVDFRYKFIKISGFCWRRIRKLSAIPLYGAVCKGLRRTEGFDHFVTSPKVSRKPQHTAKAFSAGSKRRKAKVCESDKNR